MSVQDTEIVIDELLVNGVIGVDRDRFRAQVEFELERILRDEGGVSGLSRAPDSRAVAPPRAIVVAPGRVPSPAQVARAIHDALKRSAQ